MAASAGFEGYLVLTKTDTQEWNQGTRYKMPPTEFEDSPTDRDLPVTAGAFELEHHLIKAGKLN